MVSEYDKLVFEYDAVVSESGVYFLMHPIESLYIVSEPSKVSESDFIRIRLYSINSGTGIP